MNKGATSALLFVVGWNHITMLHLSQDCCLYLSNESCSYDTFSMIQHMFYAI